MTDWKRGPNPKLSDDHRDNRMAELQADYNDLERRITRMESWLEKLHDEDGEPVFRTIPLPRGEGEAE